MNITRLALSNRVTAVVALLVVGFGGMSAYKRMSRAEDPGFIIRFAQVLTHYPGANPERIEQLISDKIEKVIQEIPELKTVQSTSTTGTSVVIVEIKDAYRDLRPIWDNLRRKIDKVRPDLPAGVRGPVVNDEFGDVFGIVLALTGEGFDYVELKRIADQVREDLLLLPDVAKVEIHGAQTERVFVEFNNARLASLGLSTYQLLDILKRRNIIIPGGYLETGDERIAIEPSGNFESVDQIKRTVISIPGRKEMLYLEDLVDVRRGYIDPPERKTRFNGQPALALAISMRDGGNLISLGKQVNQLLPRLRGSYPWGVELEPIAFQPDVVQAKVDEFVVSLGQAIAIVIGVMLLFLGLRTGLMVASLIPAAIVMAFMVMGIFGIGIDQMSLAALMIALGLLVDNAIVMAESIMVRVERGTPRIEAALAAAKELRVPLLTSSLTTAAAFLPIYLAESQVGEYTAPLFTVVTITLLCSWVLALTLTPLLCASFLKPPKEADAGNAGQAAKPAMPQGWLYRVYRRTLLMMLRQRALSLVLIVGVFFGAMQLFGLVPSIFFPPQDSPLLLAKIQLPQGTPIDKTERVVRQLEQRIRSEHLVTKPGDKEGIKQFTSYIGDSGPKFRLAYNPKATNSSYAAMVITATSGQVVPELIERLNRWSEATLPDVTATFDRLKYGPPVDNPVEVRLEGRDTERLFARVAEVKAKLRKIPGTRSIDDNWGRPAKKLLVRVDGERARRAGVTNEDIALSLQTIFSGIEQTSYREGDKEIPITLRSVAADRKDLTKLETLTVYSMATGRGVPLRQVADVQVRWTPAKILRRNRLRSVTISSQLRPGVLASQVVAELKPWLEQRAKGWGLQTRYELGGADKASSEGNDSIGEKLPVALLIILLLLVGQFNGVRQPLIILATIPLALIGVAVGLVVTGSYLGFMTFLGIVSLAGIVINNAIVLLDRIRIEIDDNGLTPQRAVIVAASLRLRPILLTTVTTMGGLLPLWLGGGPMWESMAIAIIFGLMFATALTLGFVPLLYALLYRLRFKDFSLEG